MTTNDYLFGYTLIAISLFLWWTVWLFRPNVYDKIHLAEAERDGVSRKMILVTSFVMALFWPIGLTILLAHWLVEKLNGKE